MICLISMIQFEFIFELNFEILSGHIFFGILILLFFFILISWIDFLHSNINKNE